MRTTSRAALVAGALLFLPGARAAAQSLPSPNVRLGLEMISSAVSPEVAAERKTGDRVWGGHLLVGLTWLRVVSLNGEIGGLWLRDDARFSQETTGGTKSSGVTGAHVSVAAGLRTPPLAVGGGGTTALSAGVNVGTTYMRVTRAIENCVDCHVDELELRAGEFLEPGVQLSFGQLAVGARYRLYGAASDLDNSIVIGVTAGRAP